MSLFLSLSEIKCMFLTGRTCEELECKGENSPWTFLSSSSLPAEGRR